MKTKKLILSLVGKRLQLLDESLFEQITFWPDHIVHLFGENGGSAGPVWEYVVTFRGRVKFGDRARGFTWDEVVLHDERLLVKCGPHSRECSFFYRRSKTFVVSQNDLA